MNKMVKNVLAITALAFSFSNFTEAGRPMGPAKPTTSVSFTTFFGGGQACGYSIDVSSGDTCRSVKAKLINKINSGPDQMYPNLLSATDGAGVRNVTIYSPNNGREMHDNEIFSSELLNNLGGNAIHFGFERK